ncbi:ATP-binding protein [Azospirillum sp. ST 5-10]|uniref:ATP-binding protein n=1 Tax=unclassified Azospirillum TaxID=2630922 RepID=UPI003F49C34F
MNRLLPDTLVGRAVTIIFIALAASQVISWLVYRASVPDYVGVNGQAVLAERLASIRQSVAAAAREHRQSEAYSLSGRIVRAQWSIAPFVAATSDDDDTLAEFEERLRTLQPELAGVALHAAYAGGKDRPPRNAMEHVVLVSSRLEDGSWVNFVIIAPDRWSALSPRFIAAALIMSGATILASVVLARALTRPFQALEQASARLGTDVSAPTLPVHGPREIRHTTEAFNEMQGRIRRLIADRTNMLGAISHDLRNPITTLRLRAEFVQDDELRDRIMADLDEMEAMVSATLAFIRDDRREEESRDADVASIIESVCDTMADTGKDVRFDGILYAPLRCRPLSLRRAVRNVVENAVAYGERAHVVIVDGAAGYRIDVDDDGPGVPEADWEKIFEPFYRRDGSRSRQTGGFGLGLTVARSIVRAHGGDITLANRRAGGLTVTIHLPKAPGA